MENKKNSVTKTVDTEVNASVQEPKKKTWLDKIDEKAAEKGKGIKTLWQLAKFIVVCILTTGIQLAIVNIMYFMMQDWKAPLPGFLNSIFTAQTVGEGNNNWGYVLPFFVSNAIANTINYYINRNKTFKSDAPTWHFVVYFAVLVALILFATWFQGVLVNAMNATGNTGLMNAAPTIASITAGFVQSLVMFPLQKFVLLREKKSSHEEVRK